MKDFWDGYVPEPVKPAQQALDKMAENARELGLDYEPAQHEPVRVPVTDSTYNYAKSLAEAIFKQHFASDEHYASGRIVWGVNDTVIGILTQIDNMVADMVRKPAQQEPVAKVCHDLDGHIGWNPNLRQLPDEGTALYTSPPTLSLAQRPHECSRSHPHENMNAMCELRTEIARLTNENARLKALHQGDEINTYRMTLLCIRDGLQQGMSKSIQKLQAREINDVMGLPSFASYRTSPPAQRKPLTNGEIYTAYITATNQTLRAQDERLAFAFARAIEAAHGIKEENT